MDFWDLTKLLFRRWYVAVPLLLLSAAGTVYAGVIIKPNYVATSYVQLVPPAVTPKQSDGKTAQPRNPWLDLGVSSLGKATILTVQDQKVVKQLEKAGFSDTFTLTLDSTLPIVTFEVIAGSEQQASRTNEELVKRFDAGVAALQADYGPAKDQVITARRLDLGTNITESTSKVKRAIVAIGAVSLLFSIAVTVIFDAVMRRRALSRAGSRAVTDDQVARGAVAELAAPAVNGRAAASAPSDRELVTQVIRTQPVEHRGSPQPGEAAGDDGHSSEATIVLPPGKWQSANANHKGKGR